MSKLSIPIYSSVIFIVVVTKPDYSSKSINAIAA